MGQREQGGCPAGGPPTAGWSLHCRAEPLKRPSVAACPCSDPACWGSGGRRACTCAQRTLTWLLTRPPRPPHSRGLPFPALQPLSVQPARSPHTRLSRLSVGLSSPHLPPCSHPPAHLPVLPFSLRCPRPCVRHLSACVSICPCVCPAPTCRPPVCPHICRSVRPLIRLSVHPSVFHPSSLGLFHTSVGWWVSVWRGEAHGLWPGQGLAVRMGGPVCSPVQPGHSAGFHAGEGADGGVTPPTCVVVGRRVSFFPKSVCGLFGKGVSQLKLPPRLL